MTFLHDIFPSIPHTFHLPLSPPFMTLSMLMYSLPYLSFLDLFPSFTFFNPDFFPSWLFPFPTFPSLRDYLPSWNFPFFALSLVPCLFLPILAISLVSSLSTLWMHSTVFPAQPSPLYPALLPTSLFYPPFLFFVASFCNIAIRLVSSYSSLPWIVEIKFLSHLFLFYT